MSMGLKNTRFIIIVTSLTFRTSS